MLRSAGLVLAQRLQRWIPEPFVFAIVLTILVALLALTLTDAGALLIEALARSNDQQLAGAIIFLLTASIVTLNFATDVLLAIIDPRVRKSIIR